ncbi:MAG TPA: aminotransferase class I/II-fold pyridoxal phosphate-dependent enzyme [Polyangiaceae bacterium]|nr:aminotransferase class I/II-fold pyridoxal phosphate-dependent enzyme [Polyangiaceae bacterium]
MEINRALVGLGRYAPPRHSAPIDLKLDAGESAGEHAKYPNASALEAYLAERYGIARDQVVVTAGADDALDRSCRAFLGPEREIIMPVPTFEMLGRYARIAGGIVREVSWPGGAYPVDAVLRAVNEETSIIAVVSPNNPTGAVACAEDLERLSRAAPQALLLVDLAYVEFADEDLTQAALALPNALATRTLSKAWGLAGLRVGYALGSASIVEWLRRVGNPYAVAAPSLATARRCLESGEAAMRGRVAAVRRERGELARLLERLGFEATASQANFVYARSPKAPWLRDGLAGLGIGVRLIGDDAVRITCPGDAEPFARLAMGIESALAPQAILFDMDGVLADVSGSYRRAIVETAASFGVAVSAGDVARAKAAGDANNDWLLTQRLLSERGVQAPLSEIIARFEAIYAEHAASERLIPPRALLDRLGVPFGVVTGRPRAQAERFLQTWGIAPRALVCMEDAPPKPDPKPVRLALEQLGVERAWLVGDTPDDVRAARACGVVPIGFGAELPESARTLSDLCLLEELLP